MTLNYALVGCGRISSNHLAAAKNNHLHIRALCDIVPRALKESIERHELKGVHTYANYHEMLEKEDLDLVAIATESGNHATIAIDCLQAGINLIVEKPIALSLDEIDDMIDLANEKDLILCPCHQNRFNRSIVKIREALDHGRLGRLLHGAAHIRWNRGKNYYTQAAWRGTWNLDGGALMNQCIHNIDLLRWLMGNDIEEVFAYTDQLMHPYIEAEDLGLALIKFKNRSYGLVEGTTNTFPSNLEETLYLFGSTGTVKAGGKSLNILDEWRFADGIDDSDEVKATYHENPPDIYGYGHTPLYTDVIESIKDGREPLIPAKAGRNAVELVLAMYESAATGKPVRFPIGGIRTSDFSEKFSFSHSSII